MDQEMRHPIPQDITGFKFRLVGDITLKQFTYLACGGGLVWLSYALPVWGIVKFPLIFLFGGAALILTFVPIQGRPADAMILLFFKTVFRNNQYTKRPATLSSEIATPLPTDQSGSSTPATPVSLPTQTPQVSNEVPNSIPSTPPDVPQQNNQAISADIASPTEQPALQQQSVAPQLFEPTISAQSTEPRPTLSVETIEDTPVEDAVPNTPPVFSPPTDTSAPVSVSTVPEEQSIPTSPSSEHVPDPIATGTVSNRIQELEKELEQLRQQQNTDVQSAAQEPIHNPEVSPVETTNEPLLPPLTPEPPQQTTGATLSSPIQTAAVPPVMHIEVPNMIGGSIVDPRQNPLPHILVEITDSQGNPVRAFKTGAEGQFATATPLSPGQYTLTCEDPEGKQRFAPISLTIDNSVQKPLMISSTDDREELRKSLFSQNI